MRGPEIHSKAFSARLRAMEALLAAEESHSSGGEALLQAAREFTEVCDLGDRDDSSSRKYSELLGVLAQILDWRKAVLNAEIEADRHRRAAIERLKAFDPGDGPAARAFEGVKGRILVLDSTQEVGAICKELASIPLPIQIFAGERRGLRIPFGIGAVEREPEPEPLAVAFLEFQIDGQPAEFVHYVSPATVHDLEIKVRISRWPAGAQSLRLKPISVEAKGTAELPMFEFQKPPGDAPYTMADVGRAVLHIPQHLLARPFEFKYAAEFYPVSAEQPVEIVGHRTLRLEGMDLSQNSLTGYKNIDARIIELRTKLRNLPGMSTQGESLAATLKVVCALANIAGQAVHGGAFGVMREKEFQSDIRFRLRSNTSIGEKLIEHQHVAGGIADLTFGNIPIELKVVAAASVTEKTVEGFLPQVASYAVGQGSRIGVLCVLDCSKKSEPPVPPESGIDMMSIRCGDADINIVTVIVQGNLAVPSSL